jgi:molybdopterin-guanine dinucleotide biosynthesis protein A
MTASLILAGGKGSRFGGADKAFVDLAGQPLIVHLLARLQPQVQDIAISANGDSDRFAEFDLKVLPDGIHAGKGPLAGVAAGLVWAKAIGAESLLTVPVDTPFIPPDLLRRLMPAPAVAVWQGRQHHLVAFWPVDMLPQLEAFLHEPGRYKVRDALALCDARQVVFGEAADPFLNINTAADLALATRSAGPPETP